MELAQEIQRADWSTAREQGKLVFVVSTKPSLVQFISLKFSQQEKSSFDRPNYTPIQVLHFKISLKENIEKKFVLTHKNFFCNFNPIHRLRIASKPV